MSLCRLGSDSWLPTRTVGSWSRVAPVPAVAAVGVLRRLGAAPRATSPTAVARRAPSTRATVTAVGSAADPVRGAIEDATAAGASGSSDSSGNSALGSPAVAAVPAGGALRVAAVATRAAVPAWDRAGGIAAVPAVAAGAAVAVAGEPACSHLRVTRGWAPTGASGAPGPSRPTLRITVAAVTTVAAVAAAARHATIAGGTITGVTAGRDRLAGMAELNPDRAPQVG